MFGLVTNLIRNAGRSIPSVMNFRQFHALPSNISSNQIVKPEITNAWSFNSLRTAIRDNFTKASEYKRLKSLGWRTKFKTKNGRRLLMRRILKGRFYWAH